MTSHQQPEVIIFSDFGLPIPENVSTYPTEIQKEVYDYLKQLTEQEKKAYRIAYNHLGTSFHIIRSNGFKDWKCKSK